MEAGTTPLDRTPTVEYVVKPPDATEVMRNSCTGEVFGNENACPQPINTEAAEAQNKAKGILKQSSATKYVSPNNAAKRVLGKPRRPGFAVKPPVQVGSLVRRSHDSLAGSSVTASLSEDELQRLCGGLDMIATSNTSTFDASLRTLAHVLESSTPTSVKSCSSVARPPAQPKSVHFRSPLLLPPRDDLEVKEVNSTLRETEPNTRPSSMNSTKTARRTLPTRPLSKAPVSGPHRVVAGPAKAQAVSALREKRWN